MSFGQFKKELKKKKEEQEMLNELNGTIYYFTKRKEEYTKEAKDALLAGDKPRYESAVAMMKSAMVNLSQARDMLTNLKIATDMSKMSNLSAKFTKNLDNISKKIYSTSKNINIGGTQRNFERTVEKQHMNAEALQTLLKENNSAYAYSANSLSDISDAEIRSALENEIKKDGRNIDTELDALEAEFSIEKEEPQPMLVEGPGNFQPEIVKPEVAEEKPRVVKPEPEPVKEEPKPMGLNLDIKDNYVFPTLDLLDDGEETEAYHKINEEDLTSLISVLENKLADFNIKAEAVNHIIGPCFSRIELNLISNTPLSAIAKIEKDIAMALKRKIRLLLPIEGKDLIGVEVINAKRETIPLKKVLTSKESTEALNTKKPNICVGFDIDYVPKFREFQSFPHILIGGATGSGKSCFLHTIVNEVLYRYTPRQVQLVLVDFKRVELGMYNGIPHLIGRRVIDEPEDTDNMLNMLVDEMDKRYTKFLDCSVKNISEYNAKQTENNKMPIIVTIIDEYAEIVTSDYAKEIEKNIQRLAQKARACGIFLIVSTQRPSVKVINGVIKANFNGRIAFAVSSHIDSLNILDETGAQDLAGKGDMLVGGNGPTERLQSPYITGEEIDRVVKFVVEHNR